MAMHYEQTINFAKIDLILTVDHDVGWPKGTMRSTLIVEPSEPVGKTVWPIEQDFSTSRFWQTFKMLGRAVEERVETVIDRGHEEHEDGIAVHVGPAY